jgi:hypothetical protein
MPANAHLPKRAFDSLQVFALHLHRAESKAVAQIVTEVPLALGLALRMPLKLYVSVYFDLGAVLKGKRALDAETEGFLTD